MGMEVRGVFRHIGQRVVDLVVQDHLHVVEVGQRDPCAPAKRHLPVAVERTSWIHADRQRVHMGIAFPPVCEEVADRAFDRGVLLVVPIDAKDQETPSGMADRGPDLLDRAGPLDIGQQPRLAGGDFNGR
jgi:hypothetical protein